MARPDCPRCGSELVTIAVPDSPSEWVEELRGGGGRPHPVTDRAPSWLCRACGLRWEPAPDAATDSTREDPEAGAADRVARPMREYAELLKLGPERPFVTATGGSALKPLPVPRRGRRVVGTAMAIAAIAAVVMVALQAPRSVPDAGQPEPSDAADGVMGSGPIAPSPSASAERRGLRVVLDAAQPCWVRVVADGAIVEEITLAPGDIVAYRAKRDLELRLGNAGGVTVRINGERVEAGTAGEVVVLDVAWQRGEVLIERG